MTPLKHHLVETTPAEAEIERLLGATEERLAERQRQRRRLWVALPLCALPCVLVGMALERPGRKELAARQEDRLAPPKGSPVNPLTASLVTLPDGTTWRLDPGSFVELEDAGMKSVRLALRRGRLRVATGLEQRPVTVAIGRYRAEVASGELTIERTLSEFTVQLLRGRAVIQGDEEATALESGQSWTGSVAADDRVSPETAARVASAPATAPAATAQTASTTPGAEVLGAASPSAAAAQATGAPARLKPDTVAQVRHAWQRLASQGRVSEAWSALEGTAAQVAQGCTSIDELLLLADLARRAGHPEEALPVLLEVERRAPRDPRAGLAACTRGRILEDELGRPKEALAAFEAAAQLPLPSALEELVAFRQFTAARAAGAAVAAEAARRRYLSRFPKGRLGDELLRQGQAP